MSVASRVCALLLAVGLGWPLAATAGPIEDAKTMVDEGRKVLDDAAKAKPEKRAEMYADGLKKYARAYLLITGQKLQNDAPDVLKEIGDRIDATNKLPEIVVMRRDLLAKSIQATIDGKLTEAYDYLAVLRELDPRELTVEYALSVIAQRMEGG